MEALHVALLEARQKGVFKGVEVGKNKVEISHLQYADDALLVGEWCEINITNLIRILRCFQGFWYDIQKACHDVNSLNISFSSFFTRSIGEGVLVKFWDEEWLGTFKLADVYPRLYALQEKEEMESLASLLEGMELKSGPDGWCWSLESSEKFSVNSLRVKLDEKILSFSHEKTRWNFLVPKKVNILVWRANKDSLAARCNLDKRSIDLHSILCPMSEEDVESLDHLMGRCSWSRSIWN
nr:RNA-directed DNA polymerase, eukaryota, reverse transcriptase zinc-binding domain protein [Tanacetum cinerariifolium]